MDYTLPGISKYLNEYTLTNNNSSSSKDKQNQAAYLNIIIKALRKHMRSESNIQCKLLNEFRKYFKQNYERLSYKSEENPTRN